ncbi:MAG: 3'(2'),5'-bisphosphate nucleotidase CysQ [Sphingomonadaceae bacterium]|jgi:3'(2'), 5'-bisphosphate nucleotidase|nr:3'(2'),5'-bisphosphate nucleotidase CysQ [Sphingomonadaceae bacterium]
MTSPTMTDAELATLLATQAGELLLGLDRAELGLKIGAEGDRLANTLLVEALRRERPDDALLSEEEKDNAERLAHSRVWIVDPLDGTREFGENRGDWAVHVGLSIDGVASVGAVALPGQGVTLSSGAPIALAEGRNPPRLLVSRTRPAHEAVKVAEMLGAELVPMGSAGAKAMAVVLGQAEIYLHSGGQYEWDNCAPAAVAAAHGLHVSRLDGSPLVYNRADPYLPDLLICRQEWVEPVFAALAKL